MGKKIISFEQAVNMVPTGKSVIAFGGNSMHRTPMAFVRRLALRDDVSLHIAKTAGACDIDMLCLAGTVEAVSAGFVGYETEFGLARHYRNSVENGKVLAHEHACYTLITAFRAAAYGLPFLPVRALEGSSLTSAREWKMVKNPYGEGTFPAIPAIHADVAVIHVQYADSDGNGVILGPKNEDLLMARAARKVILTAENIVETSALPVPIDHVDIPSVLVSGVVLSPNGAWPGSCYPFYEIEPEGIRAVQELSSREELVAYIGNCS